MQLTIAINFIFSKDNNEERVMHSKSEYSKIMINNKPEEGVEELFQLPLSRSQIGLETSMRGSLSFVMFIHYIINIIN